MSATIQRDDAKSNNRGLKMLRSNSSFSSGDQKPQFHCDNCKCDRFSECGCKKRLTKRPVHITLSE